MFDIDIIQFTILLLFFLIWLGLVIKKGFRSLYSLYFFLNFTIFVGPVLYYSFGYVAYNTVVTSSALSDFMYIGIGIAALNLFFLTVLNRSNSSFFIIIMKNISSSLKANKFLNAYFIIITFICLLYTILFFENLPIYQLILTGEIGERLDVSGSVPFYITFSSVFMIVIPSAFFYFKQVYKNKILSFLFFILVLITLTAGGNKGIVSFFILFYLLIHVEKVGVLKPLVGGVSLFFIYAVSKGITSLNAKSVDYLLESPFRRLFATQGVGFIGRIKMVAENKFDLTSDYSIKHQLYSEMYDSPLGSGAGPTHFLGDLYVEYGFLLMWLSYMIFSIIILPLVFSADKFLNRKNHSFILWNIFILIFLFTMSDISVANILRVGIVIVNLFIIRHLSNLKVEKSLAI